MRKVWMLLALFYCGATWAIDRIPVQFAGLAFISEHKDVQVTFPFSNQIVDQLDSTGASLLSHALWSKINTIDNPSFSLVSDHYTNLRDVDSAIVFSIALDRETVSVEKIGDSFKLLVDISAQALFFDFKQSTIVASYPIALENISLYHAPPTDSQKLEIVRGLLSDDGGNNLPDYTTQILKSIQVNQKIGSRLGIRNVAVDAAALAAFPIELRDDPHRAEIMLAQEFSSFLVKNQHVSVLPYTKGEAIGNHMSARLANGDVFNLKIPEADFVFDLTLQGFKKVQFGQSAAGASWIYGAFVKASLSEPLSGQEFLNGAFKNGETKSVPSTQANVEDWPSYQESLLGLFNKLTLAFSDPSNEWVTHATNDKTVFQQLRSAKKVIEQCSK